MELNGLLLSDTLMSFAKTLGDCVGLRTKEIICLIEEVFLQSNPATFN